MRLNSNQQPWWIPSTERPPEVGVLMQALVDAGLCEWQARTRPHPQDYALVAWWALSMTPPGQHLGASDGMNRDEDTTHDEALYIAATELAYARSAASALSQITSQDIRDLHIQLRGLTDRMEQRVEELLASDDGESA